MASEFPWQAFIEAQRQKQANQQNMMTDFGGAIESLGKGLGQRFQKQKKQQAFNAAVKNLPADLQPLAGLGAVDPELGAKLVGVAMEKEAQIRAKKEADEANRQIRMLFLGESDKRTQEMERHNKVSEEAANKRILNAEEGLDLRARAIQEMLDRFNAGQMQRADTQNKGLWGTLRSKLGFGVKPTTVGTGTTPGFNWPSDKEQRYQQWKKANGF